MHGGLDAVARLYKDACAAHDNKPQRLITSYFIHFADTPQEEQRARERQLRYHKECTSPAFPGDPKTAPESYRYFEKIVQRYQTQKPEDFNSNSVLIGAPQQIVDTIAGKVQAAGFDEVILYFNLGLKPHAQVKDEMARFMAEVAPAFEGKHKQRAA
jgi:alkanesulfonate monooxygenase SsuD/methylene tetrahydromethanopterin reductase-like flavin-dependent oxidoreductase (luciferase family)